MTSALVLAAGLGTRLDPLTRLVAKAAVPLGAQSLVEHVIEFLRTNGVTEIVLNLHHQPASITRLLGDGAHLGVSVRYSWERPVLGSAGGPRKALPLMPTDPFLIVNGDTLSDFPLVDLLRTHDETGGDVTMAVVPNPAPSHYNGIRIADDGAILGFVPKGQAEGTSHYIGVQVVKKSAFAHLTDGVPSETVAGFYRDVISAEPGRIRAWTATTPFLDVGTPADYLTACVAMASSPGHSRSSTAPLAVVDAARRTVVWAEATVPASARLENAIVAGTVTLPEGFTASEVVIVPRAVLREGDAARVEGELAIFPMR